MKDWKALTGWEAKECGYTVSNNTLLDIVLTTLYTETSQNRKLCARMRCAYVCPCPSNNEIPLHYNKTAINFLNNVNTVKFRRWDRMMTLVNDRTANQTRCSDETAPPLTALPRTQ